MKTVPRFLPHPPSTKLNAFRKPMKTAGRSVPPTVVVVLMTFREEKTAMYELGFFAKYVPWIPHRGGKGQITQVSNPQCFVTFAFRGRACNPHTDIRDHAFDRPGPSR